MYNSVLGQANLSSKDVFATYPLVQTLVEPTMPTNSTSPSWKIIIAGCGLATLFILLASIAQAKAQQL